MLSLGNTLPALHEDKNSPGLQAQRRVRPCTFAVFIIDIIDSSISLIIGCRPGTLGRRNGHTDDEPERRRRPWSAQGSIFIDFLASRSDIEKSTFFRTLKNRLKWLNKGTLERPSGDFGAKNMNLGVPFCIDFLIFFEYIEKC